MNSYGFMADTLAGSLIALVLLTLPGLALLLWLLPDQELGWFERLSLSAGLGLGLFPLLLLWVRVLGRVRLGASSLWAFLSICLVLVLWRLFRRRDLRRAISNTSMWFNLLLILSAGAVFGVRLWAIRGLIIPLWGDSVQHAVIAQLMVENGGLFDSWLPYAPYQTLTSHFGFHAAVASFAWTSGMEVAQATLLLGQIVNALAVFALYPLATRLAGNRWAGIGTIWVVGLLSPMPGYYVNWGRYPQLAGQAILPVALWLATAAIETRQGVWKAATLAGVAVAGMSLTYYRMPFYYGVFILIWLAGCIFRLRRDSKKWLFLVARLAVVGSIAAALITPWVSRIAQGELASRAVSTLAAVPPPLRQVWAEYLGLLNISTYFPWWLLVIASIAVIGSLARRQWRVGAMGLWIAGLALLPSGRLIHLPGAAYMQMFAIIIAIYIPVGILVGWLLSEVVCRLLEHRPIVGYLGGVTIVSVGLGWGLIQQISIVDSDFILVTDSDLVAMNWIGTNTPEDARFLVNGFLIYDGYSAVGSDAGWWIPLLAGRQNTMPPQYALLSESPIDPSYSQRVVNLVARLQEVSIASPEGLALLCQQDITHVYVGQGQGGIGVRAVPLFSPDELLANSEFSPLYHQDQVWVFAFDRSMCPVGAKDSGG